MSEQDDAISFTVNIEALAEAVARRIAPAMEKGQRTLTYLTSKQAADYLNCSERHVRNLVARGELQALKDGDMLRIRRTSLELYEQRHLTGGEDEWHGPKALGISTKRPERTAHGEAI